MSTGRLATNRAGASPAFLLAPVFGPRFSPPFFANAVAAYRNRRRTGTLAADLPRRGAGRKDEMDGNRMLVNIPLTVIPLVLYYAIGVLGVLPDHSWTTEVLWVEMISDARWSLLVSDLMIAVAIVLLFFEILKATRTTSGSIVDHALSMVVFIVYLVLFLVDPRAATSVFFLLTVIALVDVVAGFSITITSARRDFGWGGPNGGP